MIWEFDLLYRNLITEENIKVIKLEEPSPDFSEEVLFKLGDSVLRVASNKFAPTDWSVVETFVPEEKRRMGIASRLIDKMISTLDGSIGAQCSSDGSIRLYWNRGFRRSGTLEDALDYKEKNSSVNLIRV